MRELLGGKGANLAEMTNLGLPIPQGFTITTEACIEYYNNGETVSDTVKTQIFNSLRELENITGKKFGNPENGENSMVLRMAPKVVFGLCDFLYYYVSNQGDTRLFLFLLENVPIFGIG